MTHKLSLTRLDWSSNRATAKHTHGLAVDICLSVRLSVRLFVCQTRGL